MNRHRHAALDEVTATGRTIQNGHREICNRAHTGSSSGSALAAVVRAEPSLRGPIYRAATEADPTKILPIPAEIAGMAERRAIER
jgi:hypothetical protein